MFNLECFENCTKHSYSSAKLQTHWRGWQSTPHFTRHKVVLNFCLFESPILQRVTSNLKLAVLFLRDNIDCYSITSATVSDILLGMTNP